MIFWLLLKLEISYTFIISWRILVSFRDFSEDCIFVWWHIWISLILLLPSETFWCKWQGHNVTKPLVYIQQSIVGMHILASTMCKMITYHFMAAKPWFFYWHNLSLIDFSLILVFKKLYLVSVVGVSQIFKVCNL
jgi:hypothetical protein